MIIIIVMVIVILEEIKMSLEDLITKDTNKNTIKLIYLKTNI